MFLLVEKVLFPAASFGKIGKTLISRREIRLYVPGVGQNLPHEPVNFIQRERDFVLASIFIYTKGLNGDYWVIRNESNRMIARGSLQHAHPRGCNDLRIKAGVIFLLPHPLDKQFRICGLESAKGNRLRNDPKQAIRPFLDSLRALWFPNSRR